GSSQNKIDDKGYWDSGCSRHMTDNISYLSDYEPFDRGYVSFGQGGCKIISKGIIKTGILEFENVYFVKDLKYNLFSVSQISDNKNSVMFTNSECIMLGRDFKLLDGANIFLTTPRRIGYLNFKTVNKLDETSGILKKFITEIENLKDLKVKIIRCNNGGEFRNKEMNEFCSQKGIKREFSNARTPQQNGVAKRRNRTLIEAARTMLADAKLPVTFWAKAVNTVCYVQNRVLVNKSQNKTPYKLFNGRSPDIGFLKPFGCHVMILNILDNLGNFKEKGDEGYFIGYSMSGKAFRVFNKRTKRVEENLNVEFLENKAIKKGGGPNWLFDIDSLTKSMNYVPVDTCTISTNLSGTKDARSQEVKKDVSSLRYIALPNWAYDSLLEYSSSKPQDHCSTEVPEGMETLIPTVSSPVPTAYFTDSQEPSSDTRLISKRVANQEETPSLDNILSLANRFEYILGVTTNSDESNGVEADISNMETAITARHTQEERIDYDEVFATVARIEAIRLFLAYASFMGFIVYQMDVNSAFLYVCRRYSQEIRIFRSQIINYSHGQGESLGKRRDWKRCRPHLYRSMIGSLMYLTASRTDIMFAVCACARRQVTPKECHLHAVKRIFRYLKGHPKLGLWYPKESPFDLVAYSDSDYGGAT
nr:retrovirus-related Pol polyprotein from transposon TNT 1-94 [Tanacetum cinerariifolium]